MSNWCLYKLSSILFGSIPLVNGSTPSCAVRPHEKKYDHEQRAHEHMESVKNRNYRFRNGRDILAAQSPCHSEHIAYCRNNRHRHHSSKVVGMGNHNYGYAENQHYKQINPISVRLNQKPVTLNEYNRPCYIPYDTQHDLRQQ